MKKICLIASLFLFFIYCLFSGGDEKETKNSSFDPLLSSGMMRISGNRRQCASGERMLKRKGILSRINTRLQNRSLSVYRTDNTLFLKEDSSIEFTWTGVKNIYFLADIRPLSKKRSIHWTVKGGLVKCSGIVSGRMKIPLRGGERISLSAKGGAFSIRAPRFVPQSGRRRIILHIVVDAMRTDALEAMGGKSGAAPNMDLLVRESTLFTSAYVPANWTRPSTVAFFTGLYPAESKIPTTIYGMRESHKKAYESLNAPSLPLYLRRSGWMSAAVVNNIFMIGTTPLGLDMGFQKILDIRKDGPDSKWITDSAIRTIDSHTEGPLYLYLNYNAPHAPYSPPKRFLGTVRRGFPDHYRRYMGEVALCDYQIGRLIRHLKRRRLYSSAVIVIHSDHGEILERRHSRSAFFSYMIRYTHGETAYREEIRVPLIVKYPRKSHFYGRRRRDALFSLAALPELLAKIADPGRKNGFPATGKFLSKNGFLFFQGRCLEAVTDGRYVYSRRFPGRDRVQYRLGGKRYKAPEELYDLKTDPREDNNLVKSRPALLVKMRRELEGHPMRPLPGRMHVRFPKSGLFSVSVKVENGFFYRLPERIFGLKISSNSCTFAVRVRKPGRQITVRIQPPRFRGRISIRKKGMVISPLMGAFGIPLFRGTALINRDIDLQLQGPLSYRPSDRVSIWFSALRSGYGTGSGAGVAGQMRDMLKSWGYIQ